MTCKIVIVNAHFIVFLLIILNNYNVNGSICESECICRHNSDIENYPGEYIDCSYSRFILKSGYVLPETVYSLDLSMNGIEVVDNSTLLRSSSMEELFLNENRIEEINDVFELPRLKLLDLSDNILKFIHEATFKGMPKLEYLNLSKNHFQTFDKLAFHHLLNLKEIILDENDIGPSLREVNVFDQNGFGLTHTIESISLRKVNLKFVPENFFSESYNLKKLVISNNNLTDIFEIPYTLEYLDLSDNPIVSISMEDFADLPALKELKLNNLKIKEVPEYVFSPLRALINLELDRNKNLTVFSPLAFGQDVLEDADDFALRRLSMRSCRLKALDERLIEPFGRLSRLDLQGNPWRCDCNMWFPKLQLQSYDRENLRCATPNKLYNSKIFELNEKYFVCVVHHRMLGLTIAIVICSFSLAVVAIYLSLCLPGRIKCRFISGLYNPTTAYTVLPMTATPPLEGFKVIGKKEKSDKQN